METLDLRKTLKELYAPSAKAVRLVEVPPLQFIMIDGTGDPNSAPAYQRRWRPSTPSLTGSSSRSRRQAWPTGR